MKEHIGKEFDAPAPRNMATITLSELPEFLTALYQARENGKLELQTFYALLLALLTGSRPIEIVSAKWADINEQTKLWTYYVQKGNKNLPEGRLHTVTLSTQALAILNKVRLLNQVLLLSDSQFVFPSANAKAGHLNRDTLSSAIRKFFGGRLVTHGFHSLVSTSLNDKGYNADWIEVSLSHRDKNTIRRIYNKAQYLAERFDMLQWWGDYVESKSPLPLTK